MKYLLVSLLLLSCVCYGQDELTKKNVSDTILRADRTLVMPSPFNSTKALLKLFPGKYANLSHDGYINDMINWECKTCPVKQYTDENEDGRGPFPYQEGVATRLLNIMNYKDSAGTQYKMLAFNHSEFDYDGATTGRFTGGLLGLAKFVLVDSTWVMKFFQPAIGAYGAFSRCPKPTPLLIGQDQYAFVIETLNGGAGGPFDGHLYLIAGMGGSYQQVLAAYGTERTEGENTSYWKSEYSVPASDKKYFRDIIITTKGTFVATDEEGIPEPIKQLIKGWKRGKFEIEHRFVYKGSKGYINLPPRASVTD